MRDIKFRGYAEDEKMWVYGDLQNNVDCVKIREQEKNLYRIAKSYVVNKNSVGQFTRMLDRNNKEIYEGDIVEDIFGRIMKVVYRMFGFQFQLLKAGKENFTNNFKYADVIDWLVSNDLSISTVKVIDNEFEGEEQ